MQTLRNSVQTYDEDGKILKKEHSRMHLCKQSGGRVLEIILPNRESSKLQSVYIPLSKIRRELKGESL